MQQGFQGFGQQSNDERIWVQGKNAAEAYLVAANGFVRLWDSNGQVFTRNELMHQGDRAWKPTSTNDWAQSCLKREQKARVV